MFPIYKLLLYLLVLCMMAYKVTLVNYINTYPFIESLLGHEANFQLDRRIPKACGEAFMNDEADFALVPVAFLPQLKRPFIVIKDYGIACDGEVRTVKLLSKKPVEEMEELWLDPHSTTSVELVKILLEKHWCKSLNYNDLDLKKPITQESILLIGDKVFDQENNYPFHYDLGHLWQEFAGLPFVFAVWICRENIPKHMIQHFVDLLDNGIHQIDDIINQYSLQHKNIDLETYFRKNIKYKLDENYLQGLSLFFEYSSLRKRSFEFI